MTSSRVTGPTGHTPVFVVEVHSTSEQLKATRVIVGFATTIGSAIGRLVEVMQQWQAAEGAIAPGTKVVVRDKRDGGTVLSAQYMGFGADLLTGSVEK